MDEEQQRDRADQISRMFALITTKFEDGAASTADCRWRRSRNELRPGAEELETLIAEAGTIVAATIALVSDDR